MHSAATVQTYRRTLDAKPNKESIVKPGELVDIVEMAPLTLTDRRIYNLLLANAWEEIDKPVRHAIPKHELQFAGHKGTDRLGDSIERLMAAIVKVRIFRNGHWETDRVALLGPNSEPDASDGMVRYEFSEKLRQIICESTIFARLQREIMFQMSSKYSLALYEIIQKRCNLSLTSENFTIEELRGFLGVPKDKLTSWINLKNKAITPAVTEVSALSDFVVTIDPTKEAKKQFTGVRLKWQRKSPEELQKMGRELPPPRKARRAKISGPAEKTTPTLSLFIRGDTLEKAKRVCKGYDIYFIEQEWQRWSATKGERPDNADAAFLAFCKRYVERNPLN